MKQLDIVSAVNRWTDRAFILDSGYYAGSPPSEGTLNSKMLEDIYQGLKRDVGITEATNFIEFVRNLNDLSASSFICAFVRFWRSDCQCTAIPQSKRERSEITSHGQAYSLLAAVLSRPNPSEDQILRESNRIKANFINQHKREDTGRKVAV